MRKVISLLALLVISNFILAQKSVELWQVIKEKKSEKDSIRCLVRLSDKGVAELKNLPDFLEVHFLTANAYNDSIQFNEKNGFTLSMKGTGNNIIYPSDLQGNVLKLTFQGKFLTGIGNRVIRGKEIQTKKLYIKIIEKTEVSKKDESELTAMQALGKYVSKGCPIFVDPAEITDSRFLCTPVSCCTEETVMPVDVLSPDFWNKEALFKRTPKYRLVYDARSGVKTDLALLRYNNFTKKYQTMHMLLPRANRVMTVSVFGHIDSTFVIDSSSRQLNLNADSNLIAAAQALSNVKAPAADVNTSAAEAVKSDGDGMKFIEFMDGLKSLNFDFSDTAPATAASTDTLLQRLKSVVQTLRNKGVITSIVKKQFDDNITSLQRQISEVNAELNAQRLINLETQIQLKQVTDSLVKLTASLQAQQIAHKLKSDFLALDWALEHFNYLYANVDLKEDLYQKDLWCLQSKIKSILGIAINKNSEDLANLLAAQVLISLSKDTCFYNEFHSIIEKIAEQYKIAVNKKAVNSIFTKSIPVPDNDLFKVRIGAGKAGSKGLYEHEFHTSLGFKVDVSTGIFLTGLKDKSYVFIDSTLKYRRDSSGYTPSTGPLTDTTGRIVASEHSSRYRVGIGALLHAYPRISGNYNFGLTAGFLTTTNIDLNLMAGLSAMFGSGRRFIISSGLIWGKATRLSSSLTEGVNRYNSGVRQPDDAQYAKPIFYSTQTSVVPTVNDWQQSWFFGITWNLSK